MEFIVGIGLEFWGTLCQMAPYLLFGFFVAGLLSTLVSPELVQRHLGGRGFRPILKAALLGVPLPLCSCGVVPVAMSLRRQGARRAPVVAFLLSTPQTGVDSILVTLSLLGPVMAIFRPIAALLTGLVGGLIENAFGIKEEPASATKLAAVSIPSVSSGLARLSATLRYGFVDLPRDIGKAVLVGLFIAAAISYFVPDDFFAGVLGGGLFAMLAVMVVAIPMYVCATASVPIAAAMIAKGLSPGAALVFLIAGPGTNAAGIAAIWHVMGRRSALLYLLTVVVCSLAAGLLLDLTFNVSGASCSHMSHTMVPAQLETVSAVILLAVLGAALVPRWENASAETIRASGSTIELEIGGMTCAHCVQTVRKALAAVPGVTDVSVSLETGKAVITGQDFDKNALANAVREAGYEAKLPEVQIGKKSGN